MRPSRVILAVLFATVLAGGSAVGQGPPLDHEWPSLEFVMNIEQEPTLLGSQRVYKYELHPYGQHGSVNGKYYGSSEVELNGHRVFEFTMPHKNPANVSLDGNGTVASSFMFGVTNRGQGTYNASWKFFADETVITAGPIREFTLQGAGTDVGARLVTWETSLEQATIPAGALLSLHLEVSYSGNAPLVKDRGIRIDFPGLLPEGNDAELDADDETDGADTSPEPTPPIRPESPSDSGVDTRDALPIPAGGPGLVALACLVSLAALLARRH